MLLICRCGADSPKQIDFQCTDDKVVEQSRSAVDECGGHGSHYEEPRPRTVYAYNLYMEDPGHGRDLISWVLKKIPPICLSSHARVRRSLDYSLMQPPHQSCRKGRRTELHEPFGASVRHQRG